jgi:molybdate transport system substrate-binding protein
MTTPQALNLLCAGAAQGLVRALGADWLSQAGAATQGRFGAVGAMKEALMAGEACDVMVVTDSMVDSLVAAGQLLAEGRAPLGRVRTGVAVRSGEPQPAVDTPEALKAALLAADGIYFPDPERATAGIHFANVMRELGILDALRPRFHTHPNGATAMRELAASTAPRLIGCTQVTEINYTDGVDLVGALPQQFELATVYTAAVSARAAQPELARRFIDLIAGSGSRDLRASGGFEF